MISRIKLERFRGFRRMREPLDVKPLTVLLGPNSAGKSSLLQAIAALHYVRRLKISPATLAPDAQSFSWPLDLGSRQELQSSGTLREGGVRIELTNTSNNGETDVSFEFGRANSESLDLSAITIGADRPRSDIIAQNQHAVISPQPVELLQVEGQPQQEPGFDEIAVREVGDRFWQKGLEYAEVSIQNLQLEHYFGPGGTLHRVMSPGYLDFLRVLEAVRYLTATRARPKRQTERRPPALPDDDVGGAGQWTGWTWLNSGARALPYRAPPPLHVTREQAAQLLATRESATEELPFAQCVNQWLANIGVARRFIAEKVGDNIRERVDVDGRYRQLPDVGYGVSQVLPIIVQGLALPHEGTLLVEQPEGQLHPKPQALLADFFCSLVEQGHRCIIETHSEALFRRLHVRTLLDEELASNVAVYFLDPVGENGCCTPQRVPLNEAAEVPWPREFLADTARAHAAFAAVKAAIARRNAGTGGR